MGGSGTSAHMTQSPLVYLDPELYNNLFLSRSGVGCGMMPWGAHHYTLFEPRSEMTGGS
jgi:hypothetical protein